MPPTWRAGTEAVWPAGMRVIARRERPHPGAQLAADRPEGVADHLLRHKHPQIRRLASADLGGPPPSTRPRARTRIRCLKDTGLRNLPFHGYDQNRVWVEVVVLAAELLAWTQTLAWGDTNRPDGGNSYVSAPPASRHRTDHQHRTPKTPLAPTRLALEQPHRHRLGHAPHRLSTTPRPDKQDQETRRRQGRRSTTPQPEQTGRGNAQPLTEPPDETSRLAARCSWSLGHAGTSGRLASFRRRGVECRSDWWSTPTSGRTAMLLRPGYFGELVASNLRPMDEVVALINNVQDPDDARDRAEALIRGGEISSFAFVGDHIQAALKQARLPSRMLRRRPYLLDYGLVMPHVTSTEWLLGWDAETRLIVPTNWIDPSIELMESDSRVFHASLNWRPAEAGEAGLESERVETSGDFALNWGFSDQLFLLRRMDLARPIYRSFAPARRS